MYKLTTFAVVIASMSSAAMALNCYKGIAYGSTSPSVRYQGCSMCSKTITKYSGNNHASIYTTYDGFGCTGLIVSNTATAAVNTNTNTNTNTVQYVSNPANVGEFDGICGDYYSYYGPATTGSSNVNTGTACRSGEVVHKCSSGAGITGHHAMCYCCSNDCNSGSMKCGATAVQFSALTLLLVGLISYFSRQ